MGLGVKPQVLSTLYDHALYSEQGDCIYMRNILVVTPTYHPSGDPPTNPRQCAYFMPAAPIKNLIGNGYVLCLCTSALDQLDHVAMLRYFDAGRKILVFTHSSQHSFDQPLLKKDRIRNC